MLASVQIKRGEKVRLEYELRVKGGEVIESSQQSGPIVYEHGAGRMLPGLEKRLEGMEIGAEQRGVIPAAEAFGTEETLPTSELPRGAFPKGEALQPGRAFEARDPKGQPVTFKIVKANEDKVTVRFLHPLMGRDIEFYVRVLMIDDPQSRKRAGLAPPPVPADAVADAEKK
jgi:FKBP-type peptidyl-prolyl cis-trans isomerase 2